MKSKSILLLCVFIASTAVAANAQPRFPQRQKQLKQTAELVNSSITGIQMVESIVLRLYELADEGANGSYSQQQRNIMNNEFDLLLSMINEVVDSASYNQQNMLNSSTEIITANVRNGVLEFPCVDITQSGLGLDAAMTLTSHQSAAIALAELKVSVQIIIEIKLQFASYVNTLAKHLRSVKPVKTAVLIGLEILEASKEKAEWTARGLDRANDLIYQSINGSYSDQQRSIMNNEFCALLGLADTAVEVYYGMGIVASTDILIVDTGTEILEFPGFDLTSAGLGLDIGLGIDTPENAQAAYPYVEAAQLSVDEAIAALDAYIEELSQHL